MLTSVESENFWAKGGQIIMNSHCQHQKTSTMILKTIKKSLSKDSSVVDPSNSDECMHEKGEAQ